MVRRALWASTPESQISALKEASCTRARPVPIWIKFPRKPVIGIPVLELLQYLALYHPNDRYTNHIASPNTFFHEHGHERHCHSVLSVRILVLVFNSLQICVLVLVIVIISIFGIREENVTSPKGLKKSISVTEKMFWFAAFTSLARSDSRFLVPLSVRRLN
eukprot:768537-Hanusia_phi.AAC.7